MLVVLWLQSAHAFKPQSRLAALVACAALIATAAAQQRPGYDYWGPQREMIQRGQQAIFMCNGLFTSNRTLEQVFAQELKLLQQPIGTAAGGDYEVDRARRMVAVGKAGAAPVMRAVFREGIGCVIMAPDQTVAEIAGLPSLDLPPPAGDATTIPWPNGNKVAEAPIPANIDAKGLQAASDCAFTRSSAEQVTLSLIVMHKGRIVHERYAPGVTMATRTRTWSTAKSIASTLIGILVDQGKLQLDGPLGFEWLPRPRAGVADPRNAITLRHVLNMSSGLETVDNGGLEYATGSGMAYWLAPARSRARGIAVSSASLARAGTMRTTTRCWRSTR